MKEEGLLQPRSSLDSSGSVYTDTSRGQTHAETRSNVQNVSAGGGSTAEVNGERGSSSEIDSNKSHALSARYVSYLGCIKDNWSSCHAAKLLDENLIAYLRPRFVLLSTPLKVRVLTSFLYIKPDLVSNKYTKKVAFFCTCSFLDPTDFRVYVPNYVTFSVFVDVSQFVCASNDCSAFCG